MRSWFMRAKSEMSRMICYRWKLWWKNNVFLLLASIFIIYLVYSCIILFSQPSKIKEHETWGNVLTRKSEGWTKNNDICKRHVDLILTYLKNPPYTPIYVYPETVDEYVSKDILRQGGYEPYNVDIILEYLKMHPNAVFLDLGANIGAFSISIASSGYRTISVEVNPSSAKSLCASMKIAGLMDRMTIIHNGVTDKHEKVSIQTEEGNIGMTHVKHFVQPGSPFITTICLDDLLDIFDFEQTVVKMDVESSEHLVLNGGRKFFEKVRVEAVMMEFLHYQYNPDGTNAQFIIDFLASYGLYPDVKHDIKHDYKKWKTNEIVFKRHSV